MKTQKITHYSHIQEAVEVVQRGGVVAVPTETVYGLCVNGLSEEAVASLYELKGRPEEKPLALMIPDMNSIDRYACDVPPIAYLLAQHFWPGPMTLVLKAKDNVPSIVRAGRPTVGLRCPDNALTLMLLRDSDLPLAGPSANPSGLPSAINAAEVLAYFDGRIDAVIEGGRRCNGIASTIIDLSQKPFRILRQGALQKSSIDPVMRRSTTVFGLTGGSGCGKTTVLNYLKAHGVKTFDCDAIYHEMLETDEEMLADIFSLFPNCRTADGKLDRRRLADIVFHDKKALSSLNGVTQRRVARETTRRLFEYAWEGGEFAAIDAIELFENDLYSVCDYTIAMLSTPENRLARILQRDNITEQEARDRINAQPNNKYFLDRCTHVLCNDKTPADLEASCERFFTSAFQRKKTFH